MKIYIAPFPIYFQLIYGLIPGID